MFLKFSGQSSIRCTGYSVHNHLCVVNFLTRKLHSWHSLEKKKNFDTIEAIYYFSAMSWCNDTMVNNNRKFLRQHWHKVWFSVTYVVLRTTITPPHIVLNVANIMLLCFKNAIMSLLSAIFLAASYFMSSDKNLRVHACGVYSASVCVSALNCSIAMT